MLGTSQVLLLLQVFSRNDLKPESANSHQTAFKVLSSVDIDFGKDCQEIMDVQSQLLFIGSSARHE
ncbi:hypothetical protein [Acinetobacter pittii]|uniref:hypothetical protein n=1 Tax=Acinetobacter pittii TaxID=48296 RepID=UPI000AC3532E|nr:hypothetical protein [Acinetobacter pittii]